MYPINSIGTKPHFKQAIRGNIMNVVVVGCGRMGAELAYRLYQNKSQVTVVDQSGEAFLNLPYDFRGRM